MLNRRSFLYWTLGASFAGIIPFSCQNRKRIKGGIIGASAKIGHMLRHKVDKAPVETTSCKIAIVGAGVSGLSAAYFLHKYGEDDIQILDLEPEAGGNSRSGHNDVSSFPWGAHYVPIPNNNLQEYLDFLQAIGVIIGYNNEGLPIYNEEHLCFDPEERLYINGRWQEGLVPSFGVPENEAKQIQRYLALMEEYRHVKGSDGKDAFTIPVNAASKDERWTGLDKLTMKEWMLNNGFDSKYLNQYVNYCCRDDYGTNHNDISAWMGIHYFAGRKGKGANAASSDVLTWPEGNSFLVKHLLQPVQAKLKTGCLVMDVQLAADKVKLVYFDTRDEKIKSLLAHQCIISAPQYVSARLLKDESRLNGVKKHLHYVPWMVANFSVHQVEDRSGAPISWDNVLFQSESLGYVQATHQLLKQHLPKRNFTYYLPLTASSPAEERKKAQQRTHGNWVQLILDDLRLVHPNIDDAIEEINIMLWGHAMAQPLPGLVHGDIRAQLAKSIEKKIHFAHTDIAGASIFEEAFYQGLKAAKLCMDK